MHTMIFNFSRQKIKKAFEKAGAGNIKIKNEKNRKGIFVAFTCPENSDRHDYDWQRPTLEFARKLYNALKDVGYPVEKKHYNGSGWPSFLGNPVSNILWQKKNPFYPE